MAAADLPRIGDADALIGDVTLYTGEGTLGGGNIGGGTGTNLGAGNKGATNSDHSEKIILASPSVSILLIIAKSSNSLA